VKRFVRSTVFALLRFSGLPLLIREMWQRDKVTMVVYHALEAVRADVHFAALRSRYNVISLADFLAARSQTTRRLPAKALIITFDDGHKSNHGLLPVIQRHAIPVTIFLCSGIVGTHRHYWWMHTKDSGEAQTLKALPDEQRVQALLQKGHADSREYDTRQALSRAEIAEMKSAVDFQSHTVFHPILPACSVERARREIVESKEALETEHGLKIYALAYPNGDYSDREAGLLRDAGYAFGLTSDAGVNDSETDAYRLRRVSLPDDAGINEVIVKTSGLWALLKGLASKSRNPLRRSVQLVGDPAGAR
jgi:peptidoglycan/xylan/chitin deacetylase (PgdA/CDA1 family)